MFFYQARESRLVNKQVAWYLIGSRNGAGAGAAEAGSRRAARARRTGPWGENL